MTGEQISVWRVTQGLGVKDAAEALGLSVSTLQRYEAGRLAIPKAVELATRDLSLAKSFEALREPPVAYSPH